MLLERLLYCGLDTRGENKMLLEIWLYCEFRYKWSKTKCHCYEDLIVGLDTSGAKQNVVAQGRLYCGWDTSGANQNVIGKMTLSWIRCKRSKQNQMLLLI